MEKFAALNPLILFILQVHTLWPIHTMVSKCVAFVEHWDPMIQHCYTYRMVHINYLYNTVTLSIHFYWIYTFSEYLSIDMTVDLCIHVTKLVFSTHDNYLYRVDYSCFDNYRHPLPCLWHCVFNCVCYLGLCTVCTHVAEVAINWINIYIAGV